VWRKSAIGLKCKFDLPQRFPSQWPLSLQWQIVAAAAAAVVAVVVVDGVVPMQSKRMDWWWQQQKRKEEEVPRKMMVVVVDVEPVEEAAAFADGQAVPN
jgi:membrane protein implicated in regulation of membrane protease activity